MPANMQQIKTELKQDIFGRTSRLDYMPNLHLYLDKIADKVRILVNGEKLNGVTNMQINYNAEVPEATTATLTVLVAHIGTKAELDYELNSKLPDSSKENNSDGG